MTIESVKPGQILNVVLDDLWHEDVWNYLEHGRASKQQKTSARAEQLQ